MMEYKTKRGNTWPPIRAILLHRGAPINLTGATVTLHAQAGARTFSQPVAKLDAVRGSVECLLDDVDVAIAGGFRAEFVVVFADGRKVTVPNRGHFGIIIDDSIA